MFTLHASAAVIGEAGVIIRGPSGAGKSSLAFALIAAAESAGMFARLISDDRVRIEARGGRLIARAHPTILGKIERRGQGILRMPALGAAVVRIVIALARAGGVPPRYPEPDELSTTVAGVTLPLMTLSQHAAAAADTVLASLRLQQIII